MNNTFVTNAIRFVALVLLQGLVLQHISLNTEYDNYVHVIVFPLFIILLPLRTPHALVVSLGFFIGICVDFFYESPGVHASASVFIAFVRPMVLQVLSPSKGYDMNVSPTKAKYGISWFLIYSGTMMFLYLFFYFSVEIFTFYFIGEIALRTIFSFFLSMLFITIYTFIFNPTE
ncbi:MAG TPA: hypothetical protein ENJ45_01875 [Phaeodactylibacter sp.]|nr:hypothetical protein [Phaeodactylibacter sp.]